MRQHSRTDSRVSFKSSTTSTTSTLTGKRKKTLTQREIQTIVSYEFDKLQSKHLKIYGDLEQKFSGNEDKINSELILSWIDLSIGYMGILKLLTQNESFDGFEMHDILVELFAYNYFILNYILPLMDVSKEEDIQMIGHLGLTSNGFCSIPDFQEELTMTMHECDELIKDAASGNSTASTLDEDHNRRHSRIFSRSINGRSSSEEDVVSPMTNTLKQLNLRSGFSTPKPDSSRLSNYRPSKYESLRNTLSERDLFPDDEIESSIADNDDDYEYENDREVNFMSVDDLLIILHKNPSDILIVDLRQFKDFMDSNIENGKNTINIGPSSFDAVDDFKGLMYCLQVGDANFYQTLSNYFNYRYILFYSENEKLTKQDIIFNNIMLDEIDNRSQFFPTSTKVFRLQGGYNEWHKYYSDLNKSSTTTDNRRTPAYASSNAPSAGPPAASPFYPYQPPPVPATRDYAPSTEKNVLNPSHQPSIISYPSTSGYSSTAMSTPSGTIYNQQQQPYMPSIPSSRTSNYSSQSQVPYNFAPQGPTAVTKKFPLVRLHNYAYIESF
ncbi:unnamed protein product [Ambrosiozyma monospora]|uniref:Unnamed protein product n=1 Tax=Ambrosiozyma monospora TaxID=43982 RepID=A0ACB5TIU1_AMBMO|nr:unnamed protein product [Ambrosiozyma monospora]